MLIYFARDVRAAYNPSTEGMVQQCHECLLYKDEGRWVKHPPPDVDLDAIKEENRLSYVICDNCYAAYWQKLREQNDEYDKTHGRQDQSQ